MSIQINKEENKIISIQDVDFTYLQKSSTAVLRFILANAKNGDVNSIMNFKDLSTEDNIDFLITVAKEYMVDWNGITFKETDEPVLFDKDYVQNLPIDVLAEFAMGVMMPALDGALVENEKEDEEVKN